MAEKTYSISEIREAITQLPDQFSEDAKEVVVTRHGKPVMEIAPAGTIQELREIIDGLLETLEIVQDAELMATFRQGVQEIAEGRGRNWEDVKKEHGWV